MMSSMMKKAQWLVLPTCCMLFFSVLFCGAKRTESKLSLMLNDYPTVFSSDVLIVYGNKENQTQQKAAEAIAAELAEYTGNTPVLKKDTEVTEKDKGIYNIIVIGKPHSNRLLNEVYEHVQADQITEEWPGEKRGVLELLKNPWASEKALLVVAGSDEKGLIDATQELHWIRLSHEEFTNTPGELVTVTGIVQEIISQWSLSFDTCVFDSPRIDVNDTIYYITNICPYLYLYSGGLQERRVVVESVDDFFVPGKTVTVTGKIAQREVLVPLGKEIDAPRELKTFNVLVASKVQAFE